MSQTPRPPIAADPLGWLSHGGRSRRSRALVGGRRRAPARRRPARAVRRHRRGDDRAARSRGRGRLDAAGARSASARPRCDRASGPRSRPGTSGSPSICGAWHVPALADAAAGQGRRRAAARPADGQDAGHLGAVDVAAADPGERLRRRRRPRPAGTRTCGGHRTRSPSAGWSGRGAAARGRPARVHRRRARGGQAGRGAGRRARPVAARADRADRRGAVDPVPRRRHAAGAHHQQAGDRRGTRRGAARRADRAAAGRLRGPVPAAAVPADGGRPGRRTRPARRDRPGPVAAAAPAAAARRAVGHGHRRRAARARSRKAGGCAGSRSTWSR